MASLHRVAACLLAFALGAGAFGQAAGASAAAAPAPAASAATMAPPAAAVAPAAAAPAAAERPVDLEISRGDLRIPIPAGQAAFFSFLPSGPRLAFDRPLRLSAAAGEERSYSLKIESEAGAIRRDFLIDKRPPAPPRISPESGVYSESLELRLEAEEGAAISYALLGPGGAEGAFQPYDRLHPPRLELPSNGVRSWVLFAYAEDKAGNRSESLRLAYRLAGPGLQAEAPPPRQPRFEARPEPLTELSDPELRRFETGLELAFRKPRSGRLLVAVAPGPAVGKLETFVALPEREGRPYLSLEAPHGWSGELSVYLARELDGRLSYRGEPFRFTLSGLPAEPPEPATPSPPALLAGPPGGGAFLSFPSYEGKILLAMDGAAEAEYLGPLLLKPGQGKLKLLWRGLSPEGRYSAPGSLELQRPPAIQAPLILGSEGPTLGAAPRRLGALPGAVIRYELAFGSALPPEPSASSPLLGPELLLDCPEGETRSYSFRYRPYTDRGSEALGGDSGSLSFTIDRSPPPPPRVSSNPASYSQNALELRLEAPEGRIFASLSAEGRNEPFAELEAPLLLPGSPDGSLTYVLRAYALDQAGNASPELGPLRFTVDASSLYVDSAALGKGNGDRESPFAELGEALDAARDRGRRVIRLRGSFRLQEPLELEARDLVLEGGFDAAWGADPAGQTLIELAGSRERAPALRLSDSRLLLRRIKLRSSSSDGRLVAAEGGRLAMEDAALSADSAGELILLSLEGAELSLKDSSLFLGGRGGGALLSALDSAIEIRSSELLSGPQLDYFSALDIGASSLYLEDSLVSGRAALGLVLISASASSLELDRSSLAVGGGPGFLRAARLSGTRGEIRNSRLHFESAASALLFDLEDSPLAFVHDSLFAKAAEGRLRFFESRGEPPSFLNSLFYAPSGAELFLASDRGPGMGEIAACAFSGFSAYLSGARSARSLAALEALTAKSGLPPNLELIAPGGLAESPKDGLMPVAGSALIDAAAPLSGRNYALDFRGLPRPSGFGKGLPDIGADELGN